MEIEFQVISGGKIDVDYSLVGPNGIALDRVRQGLSHSSAAYT